MFNKTKLSYYKLGAAMTAGVIATSASTIPRRPKRHRQQLDGRFTGMLRYVSLRRCSLERLLRVPSPPKSGEQVADRADEVAS